MPAHEKEEREEKEERTKQSTMAADSPKNRPNCSSVMPHIFALTYY